MNAEPVLENTTCCKPLGDQMASAQRRTSRGPGALLVASIVSGALFVALGGFEGGQSRQELLVSRLGDFDDGDSVRIDGGIDGGVADQLGVSDDSLADPNVDEEVGRARWHSRDSGAKSTGAAAAGGRALPSMKQDYAAERAMMKKRMLAQYDQQSESSDSSSESGAAVPPFVLPAAVEATEPASVPPRAVEATKPASVRQAAVEATKLKRSSPRKLELAKIEDSRRRLAAKHEREHTLESRPREKHSVENDVKNFLAKNFVAGFQPPHARGVLQKVMEKAAGGTGTTQVERALQHQILKLEAQNSALRAYAGQSPELVGAAADAASGAATSASLPSLPWSPSPSSPAAAPALPTHATQESLPTQESIPAQEPAGTDVINFPGIPAVGASARAAMSTALRTSALVKKGRAGRGAGGSQSTEGVNDHLFDLLTSQSKASQYLSSQGSDATSGSMLSAPASIAMASGGSAEVQDGGGTDPFDDAMYNVIHDCSVGGPTC